jgi:hypothetical protein
LRNHVYRERYVRSSGDKKAYNKSQDRKTSVPGTEPRTPQ